MSVRLPLFPLGVVLFPNALLPLHIFEPRYRRLLADCLGGDGRFGLVPPGIGREAPPAGTVGCVAEVRGAQPLPDGRSNIVVQGGRRFMVTRYVDDPAPYLVAMVDEFDERDGTAPEALESARLTELFQRYQPALRELHDLEPDDRPLPLDPAELTFHVAAALEVDAAEKQRLLELRDTAERTRRLLELLPGLAATVEAGLRTRRRARSNGKGPHRPDLLGA